ncbi:winged helix-turn-helix transcriptional regulator [Nocardia transvalensis]|uniref:winged helix-turn-helix transcriptional regulator n=1 Tax=Nocardia transvalensis TaxID=37333 RepID=UPI0018956946|nr:helix-turn-helix domain-containing protein [Nocardia transvalensis]MBF6331695.1 helix-turn-helix transcriptional regulator [Nocardia transvalensis]
MTSASDDETLPPTVIRDLIDDLGGKWRALVVGQLETRPHRFAELQRAVDGISKHMLAVTLRGLERDGVVSRTVHPTVPPQVEYGLTDLGRSWVEVAKPMLLWMQAHIDEVEQARARFDRRNEG